MATVGVENPFFLSLGQGIVDAALFAPACLGFTMQFGITNFVNFAYGATLTFGAYMASIFSGSVFHFDFAGYLVCAVLCTAVVSLLIGTFVYNPFYNRRPQLLYLLVLTFSMSLVLDALFVAIWGANPRLISFPASGFNTHHIGPFLISNLDIYFLVLAFICLGAVYCLLHFTRMGRMMRATSDDRALARVCGLRIKWITNATWFLTGALAGVAGVVLGLQANGFSTGLGDQFIYFIFAAVIIGGIGKPWGAIVGALIVGLVFELSSLVIGSALSPVAVFAVLVLLMLLRPQGLLGSSGGRSGFESA